MSGIIGYILCALGGFLFGVVITCILLAKKNLETYQRISTKTESSFKQNVQFAKNAYKAYVNEALGETEENPEAESEEDESDSEEESDDVPDTNVRESEE